MPRTSRSKPIISVRVVGGAVQTNTQRTKTLLVVTFDCAFAPGEEPIDGTSISCSSAQMYSIVQLAETAYATIGKLLAEQQTATQSA